MACWGISSLSLFLFVAFNLVRANLVLEDGYEVTTVIDGHKGGLNLVRANLVLEDGYEVTTVIDGPKCGLNPHTIHALPESSNLVVLDTSGSTFYTTSFPLSVDNEANELKRFAGNGKLGYVDGKAENSQFNKPHGFAVDAKGNVYVADQNNKAIRKISSSGYVSTIAGGISNKTGHRDGPAQNATFSNGFEITFVPQRCCLLVSDHGTALVRQINLKEEDCVKSSHSNLGTNSLWSIGLVLSCFLGLAIGIVVRPYLIRHEDVNHHSFIMTWKLLLIKLGEQVQIFFFYIRDRVVGSTVYSIISSVLTMIVSHVSLMCSAISRLVSSMVSRLLFMCQLNNVAIHASPQDKTASLSDTDTSSCSNPKPTPALKPPSDDLRDLISFDEAQDMNQETDIAPSLPCATIDDIIKVHVEGFSRMAEENAAVRGSSSAE